MFQVLLLIGSMIYYEYNPPRKNPMPGLPKEKPPALMVQETWASSIMRTT